MAEYNNDIELKVLITIKTNLDTEEYLSFNALSDVLEELDNSMLKLYLQELVNQKLIKIDYYESNLIKTMSYRKEYSHLYKTFEHGRFNLTKKGFKEIDKQQNHQYNDLTKFDKNDISLNECIKSIKLQLNNNNPQNAFVELKTYAEKKLYIY